jgi:hypothetical protein
MFKEYSNQFSDPAAQGKNKDTFPPPDGALFFYW